MSHFTVLVKVPKSKLDEHDGELQSAVEEMLAPYQENNMGDCPAQYMEFQDKETEMLEEYENATTERVRLADGTTHPRHDNRFYQEKEDDENPKPFKKKVFVLPEGAELVEVSWKEVYPTFEEYAKDWHGYEERDQKEGRYGYWENPNRKWDWWVIGGRWSGLLPKNGGDNVDACLVSELNIDAMNAEVEERIDKWWEQYQKYLQVKRGEIKKEDLETEDMFAVGYDIPHTLQDLGIIRCVKPREKVLDENGKPVRDEDGDIKWTEGEFEEDEVDLGYIKTFHRHHWEFGTYAALDNEGWHQKGEMGWWGMSSETADEARDWNRSFMECHVLNEEPDTTLVVVDCHI